MGRGRTHLDGCKSAAWRRGLSGKERLRESRGRSEALWGIREQERRGFRRRSGPAVGWLGGGGCAVVVVCCPRRYCRVVVSSPSHSTVGSVSTVLKQVSSLVVEKSAENSRSSRRSFRSGPWFRMMQGLGCWVSGGELLRCWQTVCWRQAKRRRETVNVTSGRECVSGCGASERATLAWGKIWVLRGRDDCYTGASRKGPETARGRKRVTTARRRRGWKKRGRGERRRE